MPARRSAQLEQIIRGQEATRERQEQQRFLIANTGSDNESAVPQTEPVENWRLPPNHKSPYYERIRGYLNLMKRDDCDPRHAEAYMRLEHPTLDGLSVSRFRKEVKIAVACIDACTTSENEATAQSFGL